MSASVFAIAAAVALGQVFGPKQLSVESAKCASCHQQDNAGLVQQWGASRHFGANVGCYECHGADPADADAFEHYDQSISVLVTPKDCARCHAQEAEEFAGSHHAAGGRILGSLDNVLADVVEGNRAMETPGHPEGVAASAVNGCWQCHGAEVRVIGEGELDPATYPNSGIGRINPDGSEGACNACHLRHEFSVAQARHPDTCGKCHLGPDHPQKEIYEESKHGIAFFGHMDEMNLDSPKWVVGEDYWAAPTCATCHVSATRTQPITHDIGMRISWNNRPEVSTRPELADAKMGLPGKNVPWQVRRGNMQDVCTACHAEQWVENFYEQYDALIELYNEKFAKPSQALYALSIPLKEVAAPFTTEADWSYWELWHHEGRRARHGASMMAPDYTHWHGTYDVAKNFYMQFVPALRGMIRDGEASGDAGRVRAAAALRAKLDEVLNTDDHKWFLGKTDPADLERRRKAQEEFKARYDSD
jgi:hydroxylamine dehydrogenase